MARIKVKVKAKILTNRNGIPILNPKNGKLQYG